MAGRSPTEQAEFRKITTLSLDVVRDRGLRNEHNDEDGRIIISI